MSVRPLGAAPIAHAVAVLTVVGVALQLVLIPDLAATLIPWGLSILIFTAAALAVGWLIAWKRPRMALGWIMLAIAFLFGLQGLSYAIVTLTVVILYGAIVVIASLLPGLRSFGVALATLVAAALLLPLLRAVRRVVDRRFNREQYDAQRVVEAFGERIRNGADPHRAGHDLVPAVEQTLPPGAIGVWTPERS